MQMGSSVFGFLTTCHFFCKSAGTPAENLILKPKPANFPLILLLLVFFIMLVSSPLMEMLINFNQKMVLPHFLKGLERWMRNMEDNSRPANRDFIANEITPLSFMVNLLMIAILPAVSEEFIFRGCFQQIFTGWTRSIHWGVWLSAALFSAIHFQFFGFSAEDVAGRIFSAILRPGAEAFGQACLGHFLNNGTALVVSYLYQLKNDQKSIRMSSIYVRLEKLRVQHASLTLDTVFIVSKKSAQTLNSHDLQAA